MNNTLDIKRFWKYFQYDLRRASNNFGISLLIIGLLPIAAYAVTQLFSLLTGNGVATMEQPSGIILLFFTFFIGVLISGKKIYGFVTEKRAGSDFLMIPASTFEKWLSMVLTVCFVVPVVLFTLFFASDILMGWIFPGSYGESTFSALRDGSGQMLQAFDENGFSVNVTGILILNWIESALIFTLGAVCFKKSKIAKTILVIFGVSIVLSTLSALILGTSNIDPEWFWGHFEDPTVGINAVNWILNIIYFVVIAGLLGGLYYRLKTLKH